MGGVAVTENTLQGGDALHLRTVQRPPDEVITQAISLIHKNLLARFGEKIQGVITQFRPHMKESEIEISTGRIVDINGFSTLDGFIIKPFTCNGRRNT